MVYFVRHIGSGEIKIGYSLCVANRMQSMFWEFGRIELLAVIHGQRDLERAHHAWFAALRAHGEWFTPGEELLAYIACLTSVEPTGVFRDYRYRCEPTDADLREEQRILDMYERHEARSAPSRRPRCRLE